MEIPQAVSVSVTDDTLSVELSGGRMIAVPLEWFPRLLHGTQEERANWRLIGRGEGIHWEDLDEDISVEGLIKGNLPVKDKHLSNSGWRNAIPNLRPDIK